MQSSEHSSLSTALVNYKLFKTELGSRVKHAYLSFRLQVALTEIEYGPDFHTVVVARQGKLRFRLLLQLKRDLAKQEEHSDRLHRTDALIN